MDLDVSSLPSDTWWGLLLSGLIGSIVGGVATGAAVLWGFRAEGRRLAEQELARLNAEVHRVAWGLVAKMDTKADRDDATAWLLTDRTGVVDLVASVQAVVARAQAVNKTYADAQTALGSEFSKVFSRYPQADTQDRRYAHEQRARKLMGAITENVVTYSADPKGFVAIKLPPPALAILDDENGNESA